jgi:hypothetical protein
MAEIIRQRERLTVEQYALLFKWEDDPHAGFNFPCDKDGNILVNDLADAAIDNLAKCFDGTYDVIYEGIENQSYNYSEPAILKCNCGNRVYLDGFTNTCDKCHADYNMSGQRLASRSQ